MSSISLRLHLESKQVYTPQVGLEPTTSRLTAARSTIELLRNEPEDLNIPSKPNTENLFIRLFLVKPSADQHMSAEYIAVLTPHACLPRTLRGALLYWDISSRGGLHA